MLHLFLHLHGEHLARYEFQELDVARLMQHHERQLTEVRQPDDADRAVGNDIERTHRAAEVRVLTICGADILNPPRLVVLVEIDTVLIDVHVLSNGAAYIGNELLHGRKKSSLCIASIFVASMRLDVVLMDIAQQSIKDTCTCISVRTCNTFFGFYIDSTHTPFVLLDLCCGESVEQLILYHSPLDRVRTLLVEIPDVLAFELFHRPPLHFDHSIVYIAHVVFDFHTTLEDLSGLVSL